MQVAKSQSVGKQSDGNRFVYSFQPHVNKSERKRETQKQEKHLDFTVLYFTLSSTEFLFGREMRDARREEGKMSTQCARDRDSSHQVVKGNSRERERESPLLFGCVRRPLSHSVVVIGARTHSFDSLRVLTDLCVCVLLLSLSLFRVISISLVISMVLLLCFNLSPISVRAAKSSTTTSNSKCQLKLPPF